MKTTTRLLLLLACVAGQLGAQTAQSRTSLYAEVDSLFSDSGDTAITPADLRQSLKNIVASAANPTADGTPVVTSGSYANPAWITSLAWSKLTAVPTSLSLLGITNGAALDTIGANGGSYYLSRSNHTGAQAISTITGLQTALDGKEAALGNPASNGYVLSSTTGGTRSWVAMSGGGGTWGSITGTLSAQTDLQSALDGKLGTSATAADVNPAGTGIAAALAVKLSTSGTAADVNPAGTSIAAALAGKLGTSATAADVNPAGTSIAAALGGKEPTISAGTTGQYWRGDKSWQNLNATAVGLGNVENTALSTWAGSTNIVTLGNVTTGTWSGTAVAVNKGGTGQTSYTNGQLLIGNTTSGGLDKAPLTAGTGITITNGAGAITINATGSGTKTYAKLTALDGNPPASNYATFDTRNSVPVLDFDDSTEEATVFSSIMPEGASLGSGLIIRIQWAATSATTGAVRWGVQLERGNTDLDSDSFDTAAEAHSTTSGTSGTVTITEITTTNIDGITAGDGYRLKVYRDVTDTTNDTMTGDAELVWVEVRSAL